MLESGGAPISLEAYLDALRGGTVSARKLRDLSLLPLPNGLCLVIACDSNAGNGEKPMDGHPNSAEEVAVSALKVPVMEVLAAGAEPLLVADNLCVEMQPYGKRIIERMRAELNRCGLTHVQLTGSTEDNMKTVQTGVGVTVLGIAAESELRAGRTQDGDLVYCVGVPQSGIDAPYSEFADHVAKISTVQRLRKMESVREILPIGSKGARYEANELARVAGLEFVEDAAQQIDLGTSAGSSTAVLVSVSQEGIANLKQGADVPCFRIGIMRKRQENR